MSRERPFFRPFFESAKGGRVPSRRLLLISSHFPPAETAGALRWQKLAAHAAEHDFGLDVITLDPNQLPSYDAARLDDLPPGTRVFGVARRRLWIESLENTLWSRLRALRPAPEAAAAVGEAPAATPASFSRDELKGLPRTPRDWIRAWHAGMEFAREARWARAAAALARQIFDSSRHLAVVSCGPPHLAHEGARRLAEITRLPLVLDLRDPWSLVERLPEDIASPLWLRLAARLEARAVERAALVVMNSEPAAAAMRARYPARADAVMAVCNGVDGPPLPPPPADGPFRVAYLGTIYLDRDPRPFLAAAGRTLAALGLGPDRFRIEFMGDAGSFGGVPTPTLAAAAGLEDHFALHPPRPHAEALEFLSRAHLLLNLPQDSHLAIPSKLFDYMRASAWLLALAEPDSATAQLLADTDADVVAPSDEAGIEAVLRTRFAQRAGGEPARALARDTRFSRARQAQKLFGALDRLVS